MENFICYYENKNSKRPCPICGSINLAYDSTRRDKKKNALDVYIRCQACGHKSHAHKYVEDAIREWNGGRAHVSGNREMWEMRGSDTVYPDEALWKMDAGEC